MLLLPYLYPGAGGTWGTMGYIEMSQTVSLFSKRAHVSAEKDTSISMKRKCSAVPLGRGPAVGASLSDT